MGRASGTRSVPNPFKDILMNRKLNLALWSAAGILAVAFLVSSSTKLFAPGRPSSGASL